MRSSCRLSSHSGDHAELRVIEAEYAPRDDKLEPITWNSVTSNWGSTSYFSYDTLLKENKAAYEGLRQELFATIGRVMRNDFPKQE